MLFYHISCTSETNQTIYKHKQNINLHGSYFYKFQIFGMNGYLLSTTADYIHELNITTMNNKIIYDERFQI